MNLTKKQADTLDYMRQGRIVWGRYIGKTPGLFGKTALLKKPQFKEGRSVIGEQIIRPDGSEETIFFHRDDVVLFEQVGAQFDDVDTGLGYGWHKFRLSDFELIPWNDIFDS